MKKAVFLDKDGTLIPDIPYNVNPDIITIQEEAIEGLQLLQEHGYLLVAVSNQSGVAKGYFKVEDLQAVTQRIKDLLQQYCVTINGFYYCPHFPGAVVAEYGIACQCRKPAPGLLIKAANDLQIDLTQSWMIGDILNDVEAGKRAECKTILINNGNETEWMLNEYRMPDFKAASINEAARYIVNFSSIKNKQYARGLV